MGESDCKPWLCACVSSRRAGAEAAASWSSQACPWYPAWGSQKCISTCLTSLPYVASSEVRNLAHWRKIQVYFHKTKRVNAAFFFFFSSKWQLALVVSFPDWQVNKNLLVQKGAIMRGINTHFLSLFLMLCNSLIDRQWSRMCSISWISFIKIDTFRVRQEPKLVTKTRKINTTANLRTQFILLVT